MHAPPDATPLSVEPIPIPMKKQTDKLDLPNESNEAFRLLNSIYELGDDIKIHSMAEECMKNFPNNPDILNLIYLAEINLGLQGYSCSEEILRVAIPFLKQLAAKKKLKAYRYQMQYNLGNVYLVLKDYQQAIIYYEKSLDEEPKQAECLKNLGSAYEFSGDIERAQNCYKKSLAIEPLLFEGLLSLAILLIKKKDEYENGLKYLNQIISSKLNRKHLLSVYGWKAFANLKLGNLAQGVADVENAFSIDSEPTWLWSIAGRLYAMIRRANRDWISPSKKFWKRLIASYPENAEAWAELGYIYRAMGKQDNYPQKAKEAFLKSLELGYQDDGLVWDRIGHLYQDEENWIEAEKAFRIATSISPEKFGYCHGVSLMNLGQYDEALPLVLDAAVKHQPDAMSWFQVATCYANLNRFFEAEKAYWQSIELDNNYPKAWYDLGGFYWNCGEGAKAMEIWGIALEKFPNHELADKAREFLSSQIL